MTAPVVRGGETPATARRLVALALLAPVAWLVHLGAGVAAVPAACDVESGWPVHLTTVLTLPPALVGAVLCRRAARAARDDDAGRRSSFVGRVGWVLGLLFAALIVAEGLPALVLDPCR